MARNGYYHGDEFIEYKRGNLSGQYGPSSKNTHAKKTGYNSGTYYKSRNNHKSSHKTKKSNPNITTSKKDKNSFLKNNNQYSKKLESNKCIFCGKEYNRNIYLLCPYCYINCSKCGRKYNIKLNCSCPDCGSSNESNISNKSAKNHEKSVYNNTRVEESKKWHEQNQIKSNYSYRSSSKPKSENYKVSSNKYEYSNSNHKSKGPYLANWPYSGNKPYTNFDDPTFKPNWSCAPKSSNSTSNDSWFSEFACLGIIMVFFIIVILSLM